VSIEDAQKAAGSRPVPGQVRLMVAADVEPAAGPPREPLPDIAGKDPFASQLRAAGLLDDGQLEEEEE
jgi:hypothetical protein